VEWRHQLYPFWGYYSQMLDYISGYHFGDKVGFFIIGVSSINSVDVSRIKASMLLLYLLEKRREQQ